MSLIGGFIIIVCSSKKGKVNSAEGSSPARIVDSSHTMRVAIKDEIPTVSVQEQEAFLHNIHLVDDFLTLHSQAHDSDKLVPVLLISQRWLFKHVSFGAVSCIQTAVHYKFYIVYVLMR